MSTSRALPLLLLLLDACIGRGLNARRLDSLVDGGWLGEACAAATLLDDEASSARVIAAHLDQAPDLRVAIVPVATFGGADPTYGIDWAVLEATLDVRQTPAPVVDLVIDLVDEGPAGRRAWAMCPPETCTADWVASRVSTAQGGGRGLMAALAEVGKVLVLPLAMMWDVATVPGRLAGEPDPPPLLTGVLLRSNRPVPVQAPEGMAPVWLAEPCEGPGPCVRRWVAVARPDPDLPPPGIQALLRWSHDICTVDATWTIPFPSTESGTLDRRLSGLPPQPLAALPVTRGALTDVSEP